MVDDPVFLQQGLPRKGAQQKIHPHGQDKDQYNKVVPLYLHSCENHCQRIGEQKADQRAHEREQKRYPQRLCVSGRGNRRDIVEGKSARRVSQPVVEDHAEGDDDKYHGPDNIWCGKPFVFRCQ